MVALGGIYKVPYEGHTLSAKLYGEHNVLFDWCKCDSCKREASHYFTFMSLGSPFKAMGADVNICDKCIDKCEVEIEAVGFEGATIVEEVSE